MSEVTRSEFDARIGRLDRCLSEFFGLFSAGIDEPDRQTLKHHADDLIGVGNAVLEKLKLAETRSTEQIAEDLTNEIYYHATNSRARLKELLIEFAKEI